MLGRLRLFSSVSQIGRAAVLRKYFKTGSGKDSNIRRALNCIVHSTDTSAKHKDVNIFYDPSASFDANAEHFLLATEEAVKFKNK
jgi:hypothetical protein